MVEERIRRTWEYDRDIIDLFDAWIDDTMMVKNGAAQLAMWILMRLDPTERQAYMDEMNARTPGQLSSDEPTPAEIDQKVRDLPSGEKGQKRRRKDTG